MSHRAQINWTEVNAHLQALQDEWRRAKLDHVPASDVRALELAFLDLAYSVTPAPGDALPAPTEASRQRAREALGLTTTAA